MKTFSKKIILFITISAALFFGFNLSVSADTLDKEEFNSSITLFDAFDPELERQKIIEMTGKEPEEGFIVEVGKPLTLDFDDGSSITYEVEAGPVLSDGYQISDFASIQSGWRFRATKSYTYAIFGSAKISMVIQNVDRAVTGNGASFTLSSNSSDRYQYIESTTYATVNTGDTLAKYTWFDSYSRGIKAQARGNIIYNITGVTTQKSYMFSIMVDPLNPYDVIWISNNQY